MKRSDFLHSEPPTPGTPVAIDQATFSQLYDRYAPALLGVIRAIVCDETEAVKVLFSTFTQIRLEFGKPRPENQPLFVWLLSIARANALEAKKNQTTSALPIPQHIDAGKLVLGLSPSQNGRNAFLAERKPVSSPLNELVNAVLFRNCTPEDAVSSIGLPAGTARQQLRLAMQEFRVSSIG